MGPIDEQRDERGEHEYGACLRVISDILTLAEITSALGPPTESRDVGEPVSGRPGAPRSKHAFWSLCAELGTTRPLEDHLQRVVEFAERHAAGLNALRPRCRLIDITCSVNADRYAEGGFELTPSLMERMAALDLAVATFVSAR